MAPTLAPVTNVQLLYRVMFDTETNAPMVDDGVAPDAVADDGVFTAAIPGRAFTSGQMVRWAVLATDTSAAFARAPAFIVTNASPQYFGTVALNPAATSNVPILEWFLAPGTEQAARTRTGTPASVYFDREFYDNVNVHLRGRTAAGLDKNPFEFNFNPGFDFRLANGYPRVRQFALNTTWRDKAYVRQVLCWDLFRDAGVPYCVSFPVQVRRNNAFFSVAIYVEIPDKDYLRRNGLDPDGALYKADLNGFTVQAQGGYKPVQTGFEKKEPDDTDFSDIIAFTEGLGQSGDALRRFVFDNVDLACQVNYMAVGVILQDGDRQVTNFYPYRDTPGSGEWCMLPWDMDLTLGQVNNSVDEIQTTQDYPAGDSHPFYATQAMPDYRNPALWNRLIDVITSTPVFREMFVRRLRTLMDQYLNPGDTPTEQRYFERRIEYWKTTLAPDAALDKAKWPIWGANQTLAQALDLIENIYLPGRRTHLFTNHSVLTPNFPNNAGIPLAQMGRTALQFGEIEAIPSQAIRTKSISNSSTPTALPWTFPAGR